MFVNKNTIFRFILKSKNFLRAFFISNLNCRSGPCKHFVLTRFLARDVKTQLLRAFWDDADKGIGDHYSVYMVLNIVALPGTVPQKARSKIILVQFNFQPINLSKGFGAH